MAALARSTSYKETRAKLGWRHRTTFAELVSEMVAADMRIAGLKKPVAGRTFKKCWMGNSLTGLPL